MFKILAVLLFLFMLTVFQGPTVIFHGSLSSLTKESKRVSFRKSRDQSIEGEKATCLEFGVLTLEGDGEYR